MMTVKTDPPVIHDNVTVFLENVAVEYSTPSSDPGVASSSSFARRLTNRIAGRSPMIKVSPFSEISLAAEAGDAIGVIGQNGAGKSTLLRLIAGTESPSEGTVFAKSQPILLGISAALIPKLSGRENARLGCLAMGMSPEEAEAAIPEIIEFSTLGSAIHRPMETYSSGMAARLRFAISTAGKPEILLIDEALSTGDASFQDKSRARMNELLAAAGTVFLVSHAPNTIRELCNRYIWLHDGKIIADGTDDQVLKDYQRWARFYGARDFQKAKIVVRNYADSYQPPKFIEAAS